MWIKIVTNFLMGFKIWSQVGELENDFQNYPMYVCFFIFILKVMYFNSICQLKSAFFFRIIFILKVMYFKNTCDHRPFWTSEVTLVLHVLSSTSPFLSLWGPAEALHPPSAEGASLSCVTDHFLSFSEKDENLVKIIGGKYRGSSGNPPGVCFF